MATARPSPSPTGSPPLGTFVWRLRYNYLFGAFNGMTWMVALGTPMVLLAEQLGASPEQVTLCYNFVFLLLPVQVFASALSPRLGYKRQMIFAWLSRALCLLVPVGIALSEPATPAPTWMLRALIGSIFMFALLRAIGSPVVLPWLQAILPEGQRGRYFTTEQGTTAAVGMGTLLACAWLAEVFAETPYRAVVGQYAIALFGGLAACYCLSRWPDAPRPTMSDPRRIFRELPRALLEPGPVRQILALSVLTGVMGSAFIPLTTYYLKAVVELGSGRILTYSALQLAGVILGAWMLRNLLDRFGSKPFFKTSLVVGALLDLYWLGILLAGDGLLAFMPVAFFLLGWGGSHFAAAYQRYLAQIGHYDNRLILIAGITATAGLTNAAFSYGWGWVVKGGESGPAIDPDAFLVFFALGLLAKVGLFAGFGQLAEERPGAALALPGGSLTRPFRFLASMVNLAEARDEAKNRGP